ncbi:hypothetical protein [Arhodomonas sp. AD133]|uniref:hypothetical protein n=1 Tax=Arhodomonas sp. AD133 TaxID=3415009 RepID=UPI003EBB88BB
MLDDIDRRLWAWGDYMRSRADFGIGYPSRNSIHKAMTEGPGAGSSGGFRYDLMPGEVEQVEAIVCEMTEPLRAVLREKYIRGVPDKVGSQCCGISMDKYRRRIEQVHYYLAGRIGLAAA